MKFSKQIFRKVLWAPTAFASVSLTLYLANLWLSQDSGKMLDNVITPPPPEKHDEKRKDDSSPEKASPEGKDDETSIAKQQAPSNPPQPVPPPTPATPPKPSQEGKESNSNSTNGNTQPENYIALKIRDINANGKLWLYHHKDELLASWKITKSVETLLGAIEQYLKEQAFKKN